MILTRKNNTIKKFQEGGQMVEESVEAPMEEGAAPVEEAPQLQQDPMQMIVQLFVQGLQNQDCQALAQGAQIFLQLVLQSQGGTPAEEPQGEPVFRKGGRLAYRLKK